MSAAAEHFLSAARRFCALIDSSDELTHKELLVELQLLLPQVYAAAAALDTQVSEGDEPEGISHEDWSRVRGRLVAKLGEHGYWLVSDPWDYDDVIEVGLADDIADIYRHLRRAVDDPRGAAGAWDWRLAFESHWGQHAVAALRAVHWLIPSRDRL